VLSAIGRVRTAGLLTQEKQGNPDQHTREQHDREGRKAPIVYNSHQIVCQAGAWKWDIEEFCTHWLITGDTGAGKTSSGLNKLLISLIEHYPRWGGLILDPKGVYWRTVQTMMKAASRPDDLAVPRVRSPQDTARHYQP
jgi:hypothetical protein